MLDVVTVTGADDSVRPQDLVDLAREFPFAEFGILVGDRPGSPRFPTASWRDELGDLAATHRELHLSCHLCGRWVENFLTGDVDMGTLGGFPCPPATLRGQQSCPAPHAVVCEHYDRHQVNTHGVPHECDTALVRRNTRGANLRGQQVIFQQDNVNESALLACLGRGAVDRYDNLCVAALFDLSHGAGLLPSRWPRPLPGVYCGYAGGLSPDNVVEQIDEISEVAGEQPFWIDAETHLRSPDGRSLDLDRVRRFLAAAAPLVVPRAAQASLGGGRGRS